MMEISKIKELVALMADNDLTEVELKGDKESVTIKRATACSAPVIQYAAAPVAHAAQAAPAPAAAAPAAPAAASAPSITIESPMVGTFYSSPNPDAAPFIKVGQQVSADTVVCIIEAMKVFNEIKAEKSGIVESVLVKSGQSVEFGQKLFALKA